jgi:hypothetical protein
VAAGSVFKPIATGRQEWAAAEAIKVLQGKSGQVAAGIRRRATTFGYSRREREAPLRGLPEGQGTLPGPPHRPGPRSPRHWAPKAHAAGSSKTASTSQEPDGDPTDRGRLKPAPSSPAATSTTTGPSIYTRTPAHPSGPLPRQPHPGRVISSSRRATPCERFEPVIWPTDLDRGCATIYHLAFGVVADSGRALPRSASTCPAGKRQEVDQQVLLAGLAEDHRYGSERPGAEAEPVRSGAVVRPGSWRRRAAQETQNGRFITPALTASAARR